MNRAETGVFEMAEAAPRPSARRFRTKLFFAIMVIVSGITAAGLSLAEHNLTASVEEDLQRQFESELAGLHRAQEIRHASIAERCHALVRRSRIQGALEEAMDLLYPSARDELRTLNAEFYRFLDLKGAVIPGADLRVAGLLRPDEEALLALPSAPDRQQLGYLRRQTGSTAQLVEIIAMPVHSTDNGDVIAGLVFGFRPFEIGARAPSGSRNGILLEGQLHDTGLDQATATTLAADVMAAIGATKRERDHLRVRIGGEAQQVFYNRLNPGSGFPAAYELCVYPLAELQARQRQLRWRVLSASALLLLGGLIVSHVVAGRLSGSVEKLEAESEQERWQRAVAEKALELTNQELQRSARFSADASHQLKTPVTVLRAGLEELQAKDSLSGEETAQVAALIHQTFRLSTLIEDLLLLSRMDAGRLKLEFAPVDLSQLIDGALDDLGALPDELELRIETELAPGLLVAGEKRFTTIILQNLLENARKYNQRGGAIRIAAGRAGDEIVVRVGNSGPTIPAASQAHIFERFHRGAMGENVPGYGLGLNLARELARLHRGDLRLARSESNWTEFEVRFQVAAGVPLGRAAS